WHKKRTPLQDACRNQIGEPSRPDVHVPHGLHARSALRDFKVPSSMIWPVCCYQLIHGGTKMNRWVVLLFCLWLSFLTISAVGAQLVWNRTGPVAPSISKIIPDRAHPGVWYLLASDEGYSYSYDNRLYRSIDNGRTWQYTRINAVLSFLVQSASSDLIVTRP